MQRKKIRCKNTLKSAKFLCRVFVLKQTGDFNLTGLLYVGSGNKESAD